MKKSKITRHGKYCVNENLLIDQLLKGHHLCGVFGSGPHHAVSVTRNSKEWQRYWSRINTKNYIFMTYYLYADPLYGECIEESALLRLLVLRDFFNELNEHGVIK